MTPSTHDDELAERLQHLAKARHRAAHWVMREAFARYIEREVTGRGVQAGGIARLS